MTNTHSLTLISAFPPVISVTPWHDPVIDQVGHDPRSLYAEQFWLSILGPSASWFLRRVADGFDSYPDGFELDLPELAAALGLAWAPGSQSVFAHTMARVVQFGAAHPMGGAGLLVRRRLPSLTRRQLERLPESLRLAHVAWACQQLDELISPASREFEQLAS